jgi:sulfite reductase (NADPH) flavoprotein alpha-component
MSTTTAAPASTYSIKNPFPAKHIANARLNGPGSKKDTRHHEISLEGSGLHYLPGDALGLVATNCPELAQAIVTALGCKGDEPVPGKDGQPKALLQALISDYVINFADRKFVEAIVAKGALALTPLLAPENAEQLKAYLTGKGEAHDLLDVLTEFPNAKFAPEEFVKLLRRLPPRLYSIASSLSAHPGQVHLTVATVFYEIRGRVRKGVASTFLADRWNGETTAGVYLQSQQKHFFLPPDGNTPIIMVGPGTGIAPFRGFVEERVITGAPGKNWLIFGEQKSSGDFFYKEQFEKYVADSKLKLTCAWSQDQEHKVYVQHKMAENGAEIWKWLEEGADFFVCGDKTRMAADVDKELHNIVEKHGGKTPEQAVEYVEGLKKAKRYKRDVY